MLLVNFATVKFGFQSIRARILLRGAIFRKYASDETSCGGLFSLVTINSDNSEKLGGYAQATKSKPIKC